MAEEQTMKAIGYVRVSTDQQAASGAGLAAQKAAIELEAARRGWQLLEIIEDAGVSGKKMARPGMDRARTMLKTGEADVLIAAKLDRVSRSALDFLQLAHHAKQEGWEIVVLDANLDSSSPMGRFAIGVLALVAELERDMIAERTRVALAARRAEGVKLGRPGVDPVTLARITELRKAGVSFGRIADTLTDEGRPTSLPGRSWHASSIRAICLRSEVQPDKRKRRRRKQARAS